MGADSVRRLLPPLRSETRRTDPQRRSDGPSKITSELLEETYEKLLVSADPNDAGGEEVDPSQMLKIVDAFDMPPWRWDEVRGAFDKSVVFFSSPLCPAKRSRLIHVAHRSKTAPTLAPGALSKSRYLRDRFNIIKQVRRSCPPHLPRTSSLTRPSTLPGHPPQ